MRQIRLFIDQTLAPGQTILLPEQASEHVARVLRLDIGHPLVLFNGDGGEYDATLSTLNKRAVTAQITQARQVERESPLQVTLGQAIARGEKMDWILQKATELGVTAIVPLITERTEVRLDPERAERRMAHWRGVITASCEQCGRTRLPSLSEPQKLSQWAASLAQSTELRLALLPEGNQKLCDLGELGHKITLAIGPEGGFSETDTVILRAAHFQSLRLGPRVLRTETAGLVVLAALNTLAGDF